MRELHKRTSLDKCLMMHERQVGSGGPFLESPGNLLGPISIF